MSAPAASEPDVILGSREQLLHLLAEASEIEHTLMCSYLYAAFSLKRPGDPGLSPEEGEATARWRKAIMDVAIEEMGHLLMVANLTVAVGGRPHFARPNFPISPGYFPSGVVVRLTPFDPETLEHFIFLERPRGADEEDAATFETEDYVREQAGQRLMPGGQDYATVGHLYDALRLNLTALAGRLGETGLFLGGARDQVAPPLIDLPGVQAITTLAEAEAAIDLIVEQGEGSPADRDVSHYRTFKRISGELEALTRANPGFAPAWPAASNPVLRRPIDPEHRVWIDGEEAAAVLDFACAAYGLLLRVLGQMFGRGEAGGRREPLAAAAFTLMHAMAEASDALVRLPASPSAPGVNAGMSFTMLRGVEPWLYGPSEAVLIREQAEALARGGRALKLRIAPDLSAIADSLKGRPS